MLLQLAGQGQNLSIASQEEQQQNYLQFLLLQYIRARGSLVVKALRYKPAGRGFDSLWCHWNFSVT